MSRLNIMVGVPASGKDWFIDHHRADDDLVLSSDGIRAEMGDVNDQTHNKQVFSILYERMEKALADGEKDIWFNATNVTVKDRSRALALGKQYGAEICAYVMLTPENQCIENENLRDRRVGAEVIRKFSNRFTLPAYDEGFSKIYVVRKGEVFDLADFNFGN